MKKTAKWIGAAVLLVIVAVAGFAFGQALYLQADEQLFEAATMYPYSTQIPATDPALTESVGQAAGSSVPLPTPTPLAMGWSESEDNFAGVEKSILTVKADGEDSTLLSRSAGAVVFDNYTIALTSNLLEGAARLEAQSKAGYTYQITKEVAVEPHTGLALMEFQSPTDLKPLSPGDTLIKEGSLIDLIGQDDAEGFFRKEGKVSAFTNEGVSLIQCTMDIPGGFFGGVLFNQLGDVIGIPYGYKRDAGLCYALDIGALQMLYNGSKGQPRTLIGEGAAQTIKNDAESSVDAPENLVATAGDEGISLSWEAVPDALRYYVYRAQGDEAYYQLGYVYEPAYMDKNAEGGISYTYTVRAVYPTHQSEVSAPVIVTFVDPYTEPEIPLKIGGSAFLNAEDGMPSIDLRVENVSREKTVTGFSLAIFLKDAQEEYVLKDDGSDYYAYFDVSTAIAPMCGAYTGPLYLNGFQNVRSINVAVTSVRMLDGSEIAIPKENWAYNYWTVE